MRTDFWIKAASVLLAIALWAFVISRGQTDISMEVPIIFRNVASGLHVSDNHADTVTVVIRGHERFIRELNSTDVRIYVDAEGVGKGYHQFRIKGRNVDLPGPLRVVSISPSSVNVRFVETIRKTVPVRAVVIGLPLAGYRTLAVEVVPKEVVISGEARSIRKVVSIYTEPVDISSASDTVVRNTGLVQPSESVSTEPESVTVKVVLAKEKK